jgi:hypothetical protein
MRTLQSIFLSAKSCQSFNPDKKRASDGNRRPVLTSETTKRKTLMLNAQHIICYSKTMKPVKLNYCEAARK